MTFEPVIGLEVHAQLFTKTKIFCGCPNRFGAEANTQVCPVCSGMPGALPVLNRQVVELALRMALALKCEVRPTSIFARKNYFYPDLPKAYQISQYDKPLCVNGTIDIATAAGTRTIRINRIHLEEDAGKSIHDRSNTESHVDFNRCGTPLIEIVTEPDLRTPEEASAYLMKIRQILRYLGVCDGNMEEGSMRCDANISIRPVGVEKLGVKTELKNMNSFRHVERAIHYEIDRQTDLLASGGKVVQQSLLWDPDRLEARPMRSKEDAHDYRYFPEPDLHPVTVTPEWLEAVRVSLPELPEVRRNRFAADYAIPEYDAAVLTEEKETADYYEAAVAAHRNPKAVSNWMMTDILRLAKESGEGLSGVKITPVQLGKLIKLIDDNVISGKIGKIVFETMAENGSDPETVVKDKGLVQVTDTAQIEAAVRNVIQRNPAQLAEYKAGKTKVMGYFVGEIMKETKGKANPKVLNEILQKLLSA